MSKLLPSISGVACFIWVSGWTWIFSEGKKAATVDSNPPPINIFIDSLQYQVQQPFAFEYSGATPIVGEDLHPALTAVVQKIENQPNSKLKIVGIYSPLEENITSSPTLGEARAESVKSLLVATGASEQQIETTGMAVDNLFEMDGILAGVVYFGLVKQNTENQTVNEETSQSEGGNIVMDIKSFYYNYGDYKLDKQHFLFLKTLQKTLQQDFNKHVVITGYSAPEEEAASSRINLAEMRALAVRRYLVDHGVRRAQIKVVNKPSEAKSSSEMMVTVQVLE